MGKKQSIVIRVSMEDARQRSKALQIVVGFTGVLSAALEGADQDRIALVGDGVDPVCLTRKLRKKMRYAEIIKVEEKKEKKKEEKMVWPCSQFATPYPCTYETCEPSYEQSCCIM